MYCSSLSSSIQHFNENKSLSSLIPRIIKLKGKVMGSEYREALAKPERERTKEERRLVAGGFNMRPLPDGYGVDDPPEDDERIREKDKQDRIAEHERQQHWKEEKEERERRERLKRIY
jgi:hypothetical protein